MYQYLMLFSLLIYTVIKSPSVVIWDLRRFIIPTHIGMVQFWVHFRSVLTFLLQLSRQQAKAHNI